MRPLAVWPVSHLELKDAHINPHLQQVSAVGALHSAYARLARLEGPVGEKIVDVAPGRGHALVQRGLDAIRDVFILSEGTTHQGAKLIHLVCLGAEIRLRKRYGGDRQELRPAAERNDATTEAVLSLAALVT
ncbi:MAG: hypothetical protein AAF961_07315 [Planctomycetota bacterium]